MLDAKMTLRLSLNQLLATCPEAAHDGCTVAQGWTQLDEGRTPQSTDR
jgi:hypothetical protein